MANCLIARPLANEASFVWSDPVAGGSNPANLGTMQPGEVWGNGGATPAALVDTVTAQSVSLVALIAHNGVAGGTLRVRAGTTSSVTDYDSGSASLFPAGFEAMAGFDYHTSFMRFSPAKSFRWWRVDVSNAGQPFQAGRLYLANPATLARNYGYGAGFGVTDPSRIQVSLGGQLWPGAEAGRRRSVDFTLPYASRDDFAAALSLQMARGRARDVLVILDPEAAQNGQAGIVYGVQTDLQPTINTALRIFEARFKVEELIV